MEYSRRIFPKLKKTLDMFGDNPSSVVDLGCGTGTLAILLARQAMTVTGVDISSEMVGEAERKARKEKVNASFLVGDVRSFSLPCNVDLAVSVYDVFNHLSSLYDLARSFNAVRQTLRDDGLFVFDVNNDRCFRRLWHGTETISFDDFTMVLENSYDRRLKVATTHINITFAADGRHVQETLQERCFRRKDITKALKDARFAILEVEDFAFPGSSSAGKLKTWWVARAA
jgi:SAM-dependent methyltransferase